MRCIYCEKNNKTLTDLLQHLNITHNIDKDNIFLKNYIKSILNFKDEKKIKLTTCLICGKSFKKLQVLRYIY